MGWGACQSSMAVCTYLPLAHPTYTNRPLYPPPTRTTPRFTLTNASRLSRIRNSESPSTSTLPPHDTIQYPVIHKTPPLVHLSPRHHLRRLICSPLYLTRPTRWHHACPDAPHLLFVVFGAYLLQFCGYPALLTFKSPAPSLPPASPLRIIQTSGSSLYPPCPIAARSAAIRPPYRPSIP